MKGRGPESPLIWVVIAVVAIVAAMWFISLVVQSGVLPWAIAGGIATASLALWISRQWSVALSAGATVAVVAVVLGVVSTVSPGWYRL